MVKKRKIKVKNIVICIVILLVLLLLISPFMFINISLIGDKNVILNYGEKYSESGYRGKILGKNITNDIKVTNNLKEGLGKYKVTYSYKFLFYNIKKIRNVEIKDIEKPKIELIGGKEYETTINEEYKDPGFTATDNFDGDVFNKVKVSGMVDNTVLGDYSINYEVTDSNGNKTNITRTVKVVKKKPTQMSIEEYSLDGWFEENQLQETTDYGEDYFNSITMVGDSNTMNFYLNGFLRGINAWAIPCLHASTMHHWNINLYGLGIQMKLLDATEKYKPNKMILNLGTFSTTWIEKDEFIEKANEIIEKIKEISPNTQIILISIYPITKYGTNINKFDQDTINKYNYMILEMANKHNLKYLDVQEVLKDETGYGNPAYFVDDGFHLTYLGHSVVKQYIKTHALD